MPSDREELHELVDDLPERDVIALLAVARRLDSARETIEVLADPEAVAALTEPATAAVEGIEDIRVLLAERAARERPEKP